MFLIIGTLIYIGGYYMNTNITNSIKFVGVNDKKIDLFESQYTVPNGISYNSYIIFDEKIAIMDTADSAMTEEWLENVEKALEGKTPDYLVITHMEPDHAGSITALMEKYEGIKLVGNAKTFPILKQFFPEINVEGKAHIVAEGETLSLGEHTLQFFMAPMVHWPEVMVAYDQKDKVLFSADAFGKFGTLDTDEDWACEARRYYFNIVGKYGAQVQALLKKAANLEINTICPLHGPILRENLEYYINLYNTWSSYQPEDKGVFIAYASIHGNTAKAAKLLAEILEEKGAEKVSVADLSRDDMAEAVEDAFRYDRIVLAAASYDGGVFPPMDDFLHHLKSKNYQNRTVALVENGTWGPTAARAMKASLETMKNINIVENVVTIRSALNEASKEALYNLADELTK